MQELNSRVTIDKQEPEAVAKQLPEGVGLHQVARRYSVRRGG